jgi:hypothetical protein
MELSSKERELFFSTHKHIVDPLRDSWRIIRTTAEKPTLTSQQRVWATAYAFRLEQLLVAACNEVIGLVERYLLPRTRSNVNRTLFCTMYALWYLRSLTGSRNRLGHYYGYLSEVVHSPDEKQETSTKAHRAFETAMVCARELHPCDPVTLGLFLSFSTWTHDILLQPEQAIQLAKQGFDAGIGRLDEMEEYCPDTAALLQALRDTLQLWTRDY